MSDSSQVAEYWPQSVQQKISSFNAGCAAHTSFNSRLRRTRKTKQQYGACVSTADRANQLTRYLWRIQRRLAVTEAAQHVEVSKPAVWHVQPLHRKRLRGSAADAKHATTRTLSTRHNRCGAAAADGGLTSLPRAAQDVSSARRRLQQRAGTRARQLPRRSLSRHAC